MFKALAFAIVSSGSLLLLQNSGFRVSTMKIFLMPFGKAGIHSVLFLHAPVSHGKKMQNRLIHT